jgi:thioredoxin reductase/ferredoxin/pSer/pThr/pTyr-binding forkhead associated (FHA) protein
MSQDKRDSDLPGGVAADGMVRLDNPVKLPPVLDALIVGGGPFGTAAAFRAKELGLRALVIECDDLMRRIRDYAKDKQILPDYGGGDRMQFPAGGPLVSGLKFGPIDKDQMCTDWKALYRKHSVPAQIGIELTALERDGDLWRATAWNHHLKAEQTYVARHTVLAFGRGVPRRLDIPGDVSGMAFGLTTAAKYVGKPVCVIGGGTSAGEAVIAISNAKAAADDPSAVYWSYRGDKMPKVSRALADEFFQAFMGNGNVRYLPGSEPVTIVEQSGEPCLLLRTSRVATADRPPETTQLEFLRSFCIACIGEDIPTALLARLGTPLVTGGPESKTRPLVTPLLETVQPNVYLAGDVLSPSYFETSDFRIDPSQLTQVNRRGNIKAALRDGVLVAEVIAQKLEGKVQIDVQLAFEGKPAPRVGASTAPPPNQGPAPVKGGVLVSILPTGVEENEYPLTRSTTLGGLGADVAFGNDGSLTGISATIVATPTGYTLQDDTGGPVFLQVRPEHPIELARGAVVRLGRQWLVVGKKSPTAVTHFNDEGDRQGSFELRHGVTVVGRQSPDVTIAPEDVSLSRRHLSLTFKDGVVTLRELGSANGTQLRIAAPVPLVAGDRILLGKQVLEFRDDRAARRPAERISFDTSAVAWPAAPLPAPPPAAPAPAPAMRLGGERTGRVDRPGALPPVSTSGPHVYFASLNRLVPCSKGQTICEAAEKNGVSLDADCHTGVCGMDPVRVIEGAENLAPMKSAERSTLEDLCSLDPRTHRLACMARVQGPVRVEIVKT